MLMQLFTAPTLMHHHTAFINIVTLKKHFGNTDIGKNTTIFPKN